MVEGTPIMALTDIIKRTATAAVDAASACGCPADGYGDGTGAASFPHLRRDLLVALAAVLATVAAMALYNQRIDAQLAASKRGAANSKVSHWGVAKRKGGGLVNMTKTYKSHAALLANSNGVTATGTFLSAVFAQLWDHVNVAVADAIKDALEPTLKDLRVPLHFVKVDLGDVPIKTTNMFIHRVDQEDANGETRRPAGIQIDVDVGWDGECDIQLQANLTRSAKAVFGVSHIKVHGRMSILLSPMTTELPVVSAVLYGFTNPPQIDLNFTGAVKNVTSLKFVQSALAGVIRNSLSTMLVLPYRMVMPMDLGSYDYFDTYQPPVGMVRLRVKSGRGFRVLQKMILKDIPDIYCLLALGASRAEAPPYRTATRYDDLTPSWEDESCDFILYDMDQKVYVEAFDEDKGPLDPDDEMGKAEVSVRELFRQDGEHEVELTLAGEKTGCYVTVAAELFELSEQLQSVSSPSYAGKGQLCGLATVMVSRAFDVPVPKVDAATYVKVVYGEKTKHEKVFYTGAVLDYPGIDALNPMYDCVFHVPLTAAMMHPDEISTSQNASAAPSRKGLLASPGSPTSPTPPPRGNRMSSSKAMKSVKNVSLLGSRNTNAHNNISFTLIDGEGASGTTVHGELGRTVVTHDDLLDAYKHTITETRHIGGNGAKMEFRVILSGMQSETEKLAFSGSREVVTQQDDRASLYGGIEERNLNIRLTAVRGRGFQIIKRRIGKKDDVPDVYLNINLISQPSKIWKTSMIKDDTMPRWNESETFADVRPTRDKVRVEAYDQNSKGKDDCLGAAEFSLELLLRKRVMEMALFDKGTNTSSHVTLMCVRLQDESATNGGNLVTAPGMSQPFSPSSPIRGSSSQSLNSTSSSSSVHSSKGIGKMNPIKMGKRMSKKFSTRRKSS